MRSIGFSNAFRNRSCRSSTASAWGPGAGLTAYNTHRIAGENYKWAMPETKIGLFPDVGIANVLARLPWPIGLYLGLTGRAIGRADAQWLRLATHCIPSAHFPEILTKLADAEPVDPMLDGLNEIQEIGPLQKEAGPIQDHFSRDTLAEIFASLTAAEAAGSEWAKTRCCRSRASVRRCRLQSPTGIFGSARSLDIRETLIQDYRLAVRCLGDHDFAEGVRAALRDKDGQPIGTRHALKKYLPDTCRFLFYAAWRAGSRSAGPDGNAGRARLISNGNARQLSASRYPDIDQVRKDTGQVS